MRVRSLRFARLGPVLILATLLLLPTAIGALRSAPAPTVSPATRSATFVTQLPSILAKPWAERVGYSAAHVAEATSTVPASGIVTVVVTLVARDPSFYSPKMTDSPPLTTTDVAARFGAPASEVAVLEQYFSGQGLTLLHEWPDHLALTFQGSAAAVGTAFSTDLVEGTWAGHPVRFPSIPPKLPAPLMADVAAVSGLDGGFTSFHLPLHRLAAPQPNLAHLAGPIPLRSTNVVSPTAVHVAYGLDALYNFSGSPHWATGVGIAVLLWGDGYAPSDINSFFSNNYPSSFPPVSWRAFAVDGAPSPSANAVQDPSGGPQELTLDMEWAGSEAPGATINAVYAPDGPQSANFSPTDASMEDALNTAVNSVSGVRVISMSFGTPDGADPAFQTAFTTAFDSAAQKGITVLAASGDNGGTSKGSCGGSPSPQFPAASPDVVAVGGTAPVLSENTFGQVTGLQSETAWNGSGGGFSAVYPAPSWQLKGSAAGPIDRSGFRGIPDVAGPSALNFFYYNSQNAYGKGTSFATPMWAGLIAEMDAIRGQPLGFLTPHFYSIGAGEANGSTAIGLADLTTGGNCLGTAGVGWDTATGWGSPRALLLYEDLTASFVNVALGATPDPVSPGGTIVANVQVTGAANHSAVVGQPVSVTLSSVGSLGACGGSQGTLSTVGGTTDAAGNASVTLSVPGCYFGSHVQIVATVESNGLYGTNSTTVSVNLLGLGGFFAVIQEFPYNIITFVLIMIAATVLGLKVGNWRHRRAARSRAPPLSGPSPSGISGGNGTPPPGMAPAVAPARPAARPSAVGPSASGALPGSASPFAAMSPTPYRPVEVPGHVMAAPSAPAPLGTLPPPAMPCPACGDDVPAGSTTCPGCGEAVS